MTCVLLPASVAMATDSAAPAAASKMNLLIFEADEDLPVSLAKYTVELFEKFTAERRLHRRGLRRIRHQALRKLAQWPYLKRVDRRKWHLFLVDERVMTMRMVPTSLP